MTDKLSDLFAEGTAPERDPDFALKVAAGIGRVRLGARLRAHALRVTGVLLFSGALFVAVGLIRPVLVQLLDGVPQFMGVPAPLVLCVLVAGLALTARAMVPPSDAGVRFLEPID